MQWEEKTVDGVTGEDLDLLKRGSNLFDFLPFCIYSIDQRDLGRREEKRENGRKNVLLCMF